MEILTSAKQMQYKLQQADYGNVSVEFAQKISTTHQVPGTNTLMLSHVGMNALQPTVACGLFHFCERVSTVLLRKGSHEWKRACCIELCYVRMWGYGQDSIDSPFKLLGVPL